jgi:hypothetical protein
VTEPKTLPSSSMEDDPTTCHEGSESQLEANPENRWCPCGWELPETVIAFAFHQVPAIGSELGGAYVALRCPQCDRAHAFFRSDPHSTQAFEAMTRDVEPLN